MSMKVALLFLAAWFAASATSGAAVAPGWPLSFDTGLRDAFRRRLGTASADVPYAHVVAYLMTSFLDRQRVDGSQADYPGAPSRNGVDSDAMEAFTRLAPVIAAWVAGGRPHYITELRGRSVDLVAWLRRGLVSGTDPASPGYWGQLHDRQQGIVEAADAARALWIARDALLPTLSNRELADIDRWLRQVETLQVPDNNWHLYPVLIHEILKSLHLPVGPEDANFARFMQFRLGEGWYSDGPAKSAVDWYNAWGIHYELWWLRRISPGFGGERVAKDVEAFARTAPFFIAPEGIPIMGRSICYRMAAPIALVASAVAGDEIDPGLARHALDAVWKYFVERGAIADGMVTQGYCGQDLRLLDNYSGPASCLWSLRPLAVAFLAAPNAPFWTAPARLLPVETGDYTIEIKAIGWKVTGEHATGDVRIVQHGADAAGRPRLDALHPFSWWRRIVSAVLWFRPYRPSNSYAKYSLPIYSSRTPFCGCADDAVTRTKEQAGQADTFRSVE